MAHIIRQATEAEDRGVTLTQMPSSEGEHIRACSAQLSEAAFKNSRRSARDHVRGPLPVVVDSSAHRLLQHTSSSRPFPSTTSPPINNKQRSSGEPKAAPRHAPAYLPVAAAAPGRGGPRTRGPTKTQRCAKSRRRQTCSTDVRAPGGCTSKTAAWAARDRREPSVSPPCQRGRSKAILMRMHKEKKDDDAQCCRVEGRGPPGLVRCFVPQLPAGSGGEARRMTGRSAHARDVPAAALLRRLAGGGSPDDLQDGCGAIAGCAQGRAGPAAGTRRQAGSQPRVL